MSADHFTLFPEEGRSPPEITCSGDADARFACFVEEIAERANGLEVSGGVVFVDRDDVRVRAVTAEGTSPAVTESTRFPIASITKMFTAAALVSLAEEGRVELHRPIAHYLPGLSAELGPGRANLHQLLTHTGGLPAAVSQCEGDVDDIPELVAAHAGTRLWAPPGAVYIYSNLGYTYAGAVIEQVTGERFEEAIRARVLAPVGIAGGTFDPSAVQVRGIAASADTPVPPPCRAAWPSGGLALTLRELATWAAALSRPDTFPLGRRVAEQLMAPHVQTGLRAGEAYGYGVARFAIGGLPIHHHGGNLPDYSAFIAWSVERGVGAAAVSNRFGNLPAAAVARGLSTMLDLPADWSPSPEPAHRLHQYVGTYADGNGGLGCVHVGVDDGRLAIDYPDGPPPLWPVTFRFVFEPGAQHARYVVTEVGVGEWSSPERESRREDVARE